MHNTEAEARFTYRVFPQHRCAIGRISGGVSAQHLVEIVATLYGDAAWEPGFKLLWDDRGITRIDLEQKEMVGVAAYVELIRARIGDGRVAAVMQNELVADLAQALLGVIDLAPGQAAIFQEIGEAIAWLEIPAELLASLDTPSPLVK